MKYAKDEEKFECDCGHTFVDIYHNNPQKGILIREHNSTDYESGIRLDVDAFIEAIKSNKRDEWVRNFLDNYVSPLASTKMSNQSVIGDIMIYHQLQYEMRVFECPDCRSIYIESEPNSNIFRKYASEEDDDKLALVESEMTVDIVEAVIRFYTTENDGRKMPLDIKLLQYMPHFRVSDDSELLGVRFIGGPIEIRPGDTARVQAELMYPQVCYDNLVEGQTFYLCEGPYPIGEGTITKRWVENTKRRLIVFRPLAQDERNE